jgi:hypothetical protein
LHNSFTNNISSLGNIAYAHRYFIECFDDCRFERNFRSHDMKDFKQFLNLSNYNASNNKQEVFQFLAEVKRAKHVNLSYF